MQVYAHRNLNRSCWSLLVLGKLVGYRQQLTLRDVEFRVRPGGVARAKRTGQRNVHAFTVGTVSRGIPSGRGIKVRYDRRRGSFVDSKDRALATAGVVRLDDRGKVKAWNTQHSQPKGK